MGEAEEAEAEEDDIIISVAMVQSIMVKNVMAIIKHDISVLVNANILQYEHLLQVQ
jgi:hypothetical protein